MSKVNTDFLYSRLPLIYRVEDEKLDYPLKRFLSILVEGGFSKVEEDIENFGDLFNPDRCPKEFLPLLADILGFEFPFDVSEKVQRRLIKAMSKVYKIKGTKQSLRFLINEVTGYDSKILNEDVMNKTFAIQVMADGTDLEMEDKNRKIVILLDRYRPIGSFYTLLLKVFYSDVLTVSQKSSWLDEIDSLVSIKETNIEDATWLVSNIVEYTLDKYKDAFIPEEEFDFSSIPKYSRTLLNVQSACTMNGGFKLNKADRTDKLKKGGVVIATFSD